MRQPPPDPGTGPGGEPVNPCLARTEVMSFTATPPRVTPGSGTTLSWEVAVPRNCHVKIRLNGNPVDRSGSQEVRPRISTTYQLTAHMAKQSEPLQDLHVGVDTSQCTTGAVPESLVRERVTQIADEIDRADSTLSQRARPRVEIDPQGINCALRFRKAINNFAHPDIDIDFVIGIRLRNGSVEPFYSRFSVDVDWPWWVTAITAGVTKLIEEFLESKIEKGLKPAVLAAVKNSLDQLAGQLPSDLSLHAVTLAPDEIRVTACRDIGVAPFLVLSSSAFTTADPIG